MAQCDIEYSEKYADDIYEYRHVILPRELQKQLPKPPRLLLECEWRGMGVQQSRGWVHYEIHAPEPHILLFRRAVGTDPRTGKPPKEWAAKVARQERERETKMKTAAAAK